MRQIFFTASAVVATIGLAACTQHPKVSASAIPPVTFIEKSTPQAVIDKVMEICSSKGLTIEDSSQNAVVCSADSHAAAQFFLGTVGGTTVISKMRVSAFKSGNQVKAVASGWYETQNIYGQMQRTPTSDSKELQVILDQVKREVDGGIRK